MRRPYPRPPGCRCDCCEEHLCGVCYLEARKIEDRNAIRAFIVLVVCTVIAIVLRAVLS